MESISSSSVQPTRKMSDYLPNEVIIDILKRLPADSLIRCRCVCKSWYSLISTPHFITTHLNFNLSKPKTQHQLLFRHYDLNLCKHRVTLHSSNDPFPRNHFSKHLNNSDPAIHMLLLCLDLEVEDKGGFFAYPSDFIELDCSHESIDQISTIVGSSNGLLCLSHLHRNDSQYQYLYVLWNPSVHKAIFLPVRLHSHRHYALAHGFGYDPATDDYKLVRVVYIDGIVPPQVEMYTLRSGVWRYLTGPGPANVIADHTLSVFMNGVVHWLAQTQNDEGNIRNVIVVFDIGHEVFDEMPVPKSLEGMEHLHMEVGVVDGLLALFPCNGSEWDLEGEESYSIWVMREYGVVESWTKLFYIDVGVGLRRVVGFTKNGVLVIKGANLLSYEPSSQKIFNPHIQSLTESFYLNTYVESLVLLNVADGE